VVHSITGAPTPHSDDHDARVKRYLVSMGIRTVCVVLVMVIDSPVRWVFAVLAVILPYIAVVMANVAGVGRRTVVPAVTPPIVTQVSLPRPEPVVRTSARPGAAPEASAERSSGGSDERTA
jgi:Protein of unknown function (DUF3099)